MWFEPDEVERLREVYNQENPTKPPISAGSHDRVWQELQERFHDECRTGEGACIVARMIKKPKAPDSWKENRYEWLSSNDIEAVEKQYVRLFRDYAYLGTVPIDFDLKNQTGKCIVSTLCAVNLQQLYQKGIHKIGIVINTDPHDGPGEHWVSLFCDIRPELEHPRVTYFDSYAQVPEKEIQRLMKRWKVQWDATKIHKKGMQMSYNSTRHQFKNSECGMYCLYFHYCCLMDIPMDHRIPDDVVNGFRDLLFRRK